MPWVNANIPYPHALTAKIARSTKINRDDVMELLKSYAELHSIAQRMEAQINQLAGENLRLKHENEFMLRLVNNRNDA